MGLVTATAFICFLGLTVALPTQSTASPSATRETISAPTLDLSTPHLEIRQGVPVTGAPAAATLVVGQVSPTTTVNIGYVKDGAYVQIQEVYTQTFASPVDQWPSPTAGSIGLGTIQGEVGVVKTKRDAMPTQLPGPPKDVLTLEGLRSMMDEGQVGDEMGERSLAMTTEELNKFLAALPIENAGDVKKRNLVITRKMLDEVIN